MNRTLERILPKVQKPARYTGGEYNAVVKDRAQVDTRYALCFPDTYEIGMSNLGMRILYGAMNQVEGLWCERAFAPWGDMEEEMRREGIQLYGLESGDPLCDFDIIGFSLGYEMAYTNVLNMLDLAGLPLRSEERRDLAPLVVAGGTCAYNPEPLAPFVDFFVLGEGEEVTRSTSPSTAGPGTRTGPRRSCSGRRPVSRASMCPPSTSRSTAPTEPWRRCASGRAPARRSWCASGWWRT